MKIAILGTRGVPANYGGFETFAEELGARLVERGHRVIVYCRSGRWGSTVKSYRGMNLVHLPAIRSKGLETLSHTYLSALHSCLRRLDIVYVCNSANAPICYIPWLRGRTTVLNVDGLEWRRAKWGRLARRYYYWAARHAAGMPIEVVTDARVIQDFYREQWQRDTACFAYGTTIYERGHRSELVRELGLEPDGYVLYVSRLEPENNALLTVEGYRDVATDLPLVVVGDAPYAADYISTLERAADQRVRFLGYQFGDAYHALQANARVYVQATEVGGTHPALVEAMGHRNAVLAHDVPEHREVLGDAGEYFRFRDRADLTTRLASLLNDDDRIEELRRRAERRCRDHYSWDTVTTAYEHYFARLLER